MSRAWLAGSAATGNGLVIPSLALAEVAGPVARMTGAPELGLRRARQMLRRPDLRVVDPDRQLMLDAAQLAARLRLRGADSVYVAVAHRLGLPLVTWDQEVSTRAGGLVRCLQPS